MEPAEKMGSESHFILHRKDRDWCRNGIQEGQDHRFSRDEEKGGRFYRDLYWEWDFLSTIVEVATGLTLDEAGLRRISSTIQNETRRFNLREGISPADDTLPSRFFNEPLGKEGKVIRPEDLRRMLQEYYALRGWSSEGIPREDIQP